MMTRIAQNEIQVVMNQYYVYHVVLLNISDCWFNFDRDSSFIEDVAKTKAASFSCFFNII